MWERRNYAGRWTPYYALGQGWDRQGDVPAAMREWRRALEIDPQNADIHDSPGDAPLAQRRLAEAVAEWRAAMQYSIHSIRKGARARHAGRTS